MHFDILTREERRERRAECDRQWHRKFAWFPVRMMNNRSRVVWLEFVLRRTKWNYRKDRWQWLPWTSARESNHADWEYVESEFEIIKDPNL